MFFQILKLTRQIIGIGDPLPPPTDPNVMSVEADPAAVQLAKLDMPGMKTLSEDGATINVVAPSVGAGALPAVPTPVYGNEVLTDAQHGNRGGGALHALATTTTPGFMSAADKTKLGNIGVTVIKEATQPVPALSLLALPVDLTFTFATPFSSTSYGWYPIALGNITLGNLTITEKSRTAAGIVLTIKNSGLLAINVGSNLKVTAYMES